MKLDNSSKILVQSKSNLIEVELDFFALLNGNFANIIKEANMAKVKSIKKEIKSRKAKIAKQESKLKKLKKQLKKAK